MRTSGQHHLAIEMPPIGCGYPPESTTPVLRTERYAGYPPPPARSNAREEFQQNISGGSSQGLSFKAKCALFAAPVLCTAGGLALIGVGVAGRLKSGGFPHGQCLKDGVLSAPTIYLGCEEGKGDYIPVPNEHFDTAPLKELVFGGIMAGSGALFTACLTCLYVHDK